MKQKIIFLILGSLFLSSTAFSIEPAKADFSVKWSDELKPEKGMTGYALLKSEGDTYYYLNKAGTFGDYLVKYDFNSGKKEPLSLKLKTDGVERDWRYVETIDGVINVFSSFKNKKDNKYYFFVETVNMDKWTFNNDARKIAEIDYNKIKGASSSDFDLTFSVDGKHLLVSYTLLSKDGTALRFGFEVFDNKFNSVWKYEDEIPETTGKLFLGEYVIDNNANVYLAQRIFETPKDMNKHYERSKLYIKSFNKDGSKPKTEEIKLSDGRFITAQKLTINRDNMLVCAGLYANKGNESAVGAFSVIAKPGLSGIVSTNETAFDNAFLTKGLSEKAAEKLAEKADKGDEFEDDYVYRFNRVNFREDGGFSLVIQKYKLIVKVRSNPQSGTTYIYQHYFDDIMVLTYRADGTIDWVDKIPQYQKLINAESNYGGYALGYGKNGEMNFIYNLTKSNIMGKVSQSTTVLMSLDSKGNETFSELFTDKDIAKTFSPSNTAYLGNGRFFLNRQVYKTFGMGLYFGILDLK